MAFMNRLKKGIKMKTLASKEAKNHFGELLDTAQREPVTIEKKGRPVAVVMSLEEYKRLEDMEDAWWTAHAEKAREKGGWLGTKKSGKLIKDILDAKD